MECTRHHNTVVIFVCFFMINTNTVIFNKNGGKMINDVTGQETCIKREGGLYTITLRVPTNGKENKKSEDITKDTKPMGFVGLGSDMI